MTSEPQNLNSRIIRIELISGDQINGQVNIDRSPGHDRVSDLIGSSADPFLVVYDATLHRPGADTPIRHKTIFVNKSHILWATPDNDQK